MEAIRPGTIAAVSKSWQVEDLGAHDGAAERRAEDGADARAHTDRHRDACIVLAEAEGPGKKRGEPGADLRRWTLTPPGAAGADRDRRGDDLHERRPRTDALGVVVDRRDGGVGAVPGGFWREAIDDADPETRPPQPDDQRDRPGACEVAGRQRSPFVERRWRRVAADHAQEKVGRQFEGVDKDNRTEPRDGADEQHPAPATCAGRAPPRGERRHCLSEREATLRACGVHLPDDQEALVRYLRGPPGSSAQRTSHFTPRPVGLSSGQGPQADPCRRMRWWLCGRHPESGAPWGRWGACRSSLLLWARCCRCQ